ncbi:MAG TPA: enoyl-CoA hydratase [Streptosporangiaceae bacterium]|jgi:enoyl-CoA hydratase
MSVLLVSVDEGVATVVLNRPERRNALSTELVGQLRRSLATLDADPQVRAVVLTGTDPVFCAGLDLKELRSGVNLAAPAADGEPLSPWAPTQVPVVGAVNGPAITGGLELALHCDFLLASERATFTDSHARLGLVPSWGMPVLLTEAAGERFAREMSFTGRTVTAQEAYAAGLVNRVLAHDDLLAAAQAAAAGIAACDPAALRQVRAGYQEQRAAEYDRRRRIETSIARRWWVRMTTSQDATAD